MKVSPGNRKTGTIPSFSKAPGRYCGPNCRYCYAECYAVKTCRIYRDCRRAWEKNGKEVNADGGLDQLDLTIRSYLANHLNTHFFRIHVSGDFESQEELTTWIFICRSFPSINFLAFTKSFDLDFLQAPDNLSIVLSMFPNMPLSIIPESMQGYPKAWMNDRKNPDKRIPKDALYCPGSCDSCGLCWSLRDIGKDVFFWKH